MVVHTSNSSTQEQRQVDLCDFKASLIYIASPIRVSQGFKKVIEDLQQICAKGIQFRVLVRFLFSSSQRTERSQESGYHTIYIWELGRWQIPFQINGGGMAVIFIDICFAYNFFPGQHRYWDLSSSRQVRDANLCPPPPLCSWSGAGHGERVCDLPCLSNNQKGRNSAWRGHEQLGWAGLAGFLHSVCGYQITLHGRLYYIQPLHYNEVSRKPRRMEFRKLSMQRP